VRELRKRKHRDEKPFAIMVRDLAAAEQLAEVDDAERALLQSPAHPIVLLKRRLGANVVHDVAAGPVPAGPSPQRVSEQEAGSRKLGR
jgi:hydrogenase maturation protein HypF